LPTALNHNVDGVGRADIISRRQIALGCCWHGQPVQRDNLTPRQSIGEAPAHDFPNLKIRLLASWK
jgi:hypothetical protein